MAQYTKLLAHKKFSALFLGIIRRCDSMPNCSLGSENLIIISAFKSLVAKEMDLIKITLGQEFKAISLVPASWKAIK